MNRSLREKFSEEVKSHKEPLCPKCGKGRIVCIEGRIDKPHGFKCTNNCGFTMNVDYNDVIVE